MILKAILFGVAYLGAIGAGAVERFSEADDHIALACTGMMLAGGQNAVESRIIAKGDIDLVNRRVSGFGIGSAPIFFVSATEFRFGSSPARIERASHTIEGSINRTTGRTRVVLRLTKEPARALIDMKLSCRLTPQVS
jgi:hypothetical protein